MENTTIAAIITASGAVVAGAWALLKPKSQGVSSVVGNLSDSAVAVGTNITQTFAPTIHNHYVGPVPEADAPTNADDHSDNTDSRPTFSEIMDDLAKVRPPYEANQRFKHYEGVRVSWFLTVWAVWESYPPGRTTVCLVASGGGSHESVTFEVNLDDYPKLKVVERGHPARAEGVIRTITEGHIYLEFGARLTLD